MAVVLGLRHVILALEDETHGQRPIRVEDKTGSGVEREGADEEALLGKHGGDGGWRELRAWNEGYLRELGECFGIGDRQVPSPALASLYAGRARTVKRCLVLQAGHSQDSAALSDVGFDRQSPIRDSEQRWRKA